MAGKRSKRYGEDSPLVYARPAGYDGVTSPPHGKASPTGSRPVNHDGGSDRLEAACTNRESSPTRKASHAVHA